MSAGPLTERLPAFAEATLIKVNPPGEKERLNVGSSIGGLENVTDSSSKNSDPPIRRPSADRDAVSAVKMSEGMTAEVDAWAEAREMTRSDAIRQLVQLGLNASTSAVPPVSARRDPADSESLAVRQIDQLLDPALPTAERERRIRRLTEGPPEFADERIDLRKPSE